MLSSSDIRASRAVRGGRGLTVRASARRCLCIESMKSLHMLPATMAAMIGQHATMMTTSSTSNGPMQWLWQEQLWRGREQGKGLRSFMV